MDASGLVRLTCAISAFGARGDDKPAPLAAGARAAATKAAAFLTRRLVFSHLRGDGITLDLDGLYELACHLDAMVAEGDGLPTGLAEAEIVTLWALRLEIQQRMALHADGEALAEELDATALGQAAWDLAAAAAARVPGTPKWPRPAAPAMAPIPRPSAERKPGRAAVPLAAVTPTEVEEEPPAAMAPIAEVEEPLAAAEEPALVMEAAAPAEPTSSEEAVPVTAPAPTGAQKGKPSLGLFSRAILRLHDAVESVAAGNRPELAGQAEAASLPPQGEAAGQPS